MPLARKGIEMNYIFPIMIIISLVFAFFNGTINETVQAGFDGAAKSVELILSFAGIMCMWSGFLKIAETGGAMKIMSKIISPVTRLLFPSLDRNSKAMQYITANMSANLLGVGNAATPAGIEAMNELDKMNNSPDYASDEMSLLTVMNTASMQLVPTTVIALRASAGSVNPQMIIPAVLVSSFLSVICAVSAMKIILKIRSRKKSLTYTGWDHRYAPPNNQHLYRNNPPI